MSRSNLVIANQSFPGTRTDLNLALLALGSLSSSSYAPAPTYANMLWYDTSTNILKMRSEANDVWINVGYLDQSSNAFRIFDDTQVVDTSGVQTGLIGDQATSAWELGTATLQSLVSPANVKAAIDALVPVVSTSYGGVGTYALMHWLSAGTQSPSATVAGSALYPANTYQYVNFSGYSSASGHPSGTWKLMGSLGRYNGTTVLSRNDQYVSLFLRIS
jgi:hypothetical protein